MAIRPTMTLSPDEAAYMLNAGLIGVDMMQMRKVGPNRPRVHDLIRRGFLRYSAKDPDEHWQTYGEILGQIGRQGYANADCEDLASAAAAEMRIDTEREWYDPDATTHVYRSAPRISHVVVWSPRFRKLLDPSVAAGMGSDRDRRDREALRQSSGAPPWGW